jgi:hypothetical protein
VVRFFKALVQLVANTEMLAQSVAEANSNFRANLGLDTPPAALPGPLDAAEGNGEAKQSQRQEGGSGPLRHGKRQGPASCRPCFVSTGNESIRDA